MSYNLPRESILKNGSKESSNSMTFKSFAYKRNFHQRNSPKDNIEEIFDNISLIISKFNSNFHNTQRILEFREKYKDKLDGGYMDVILLYKEMTEFNLIDYITTFSKAPRKSDYKLQQYARNNIILSILTTAHEAQMSEQDEQNHNHINGRLIFHDLTFLQPLVDELKLLINDCTNNTYHYETEVFFLSILNYKDQAQIIAQKKNIYFKRFIKKLNLPEKYTMNELINVTSLKTLYTEYSDSELIVLRKIFSNAARRKFYCGIEFLLHCNSFNVIISEGRIWKDIGENFSNEQVYNLWMIYENKIENVKLADLKSMIDIEYANKISKLTKEIFTLIGKKEDKILRKNELTYQKEQLEKEMRLGFVRSQKDLYAIFFQYHLQQMIMYFFDQFKIKHSNKRIPIEHYELCLSCDEDISCQIMDRALTQLNASADYMKTALLNKHLRLARFLMKFSVCKAFLNTPPPKNEDYEQMMHENHIKHKQYEKALFNKTVKNEGDKLITLLQENGRTPSLQSLANNNNSNINNNNSASIQELLSNDYGAKNSFLKLKDNSGNNQTRNEDGFERSQSKNYNSSKSKENSKANSYSVAFAELSGKKKKKIYSTARFDKGLSVIIKEPPILNGNNEQALPTAISIIKNNYDVPSKENSVKPFDKSKTTLMFQHFKNESKPDIRQLIDNQEPSKKNKLSISHSLDNTRLFTVKLKQELPLPNIQLILIDELRYGNTAFDALCLLLSINDHSINLDLAEKTCKNLLVFTTNEEAISRSLYPLITIALAAEYLTKIGHLSQKIQYKTLSVVEELLKLGESIQSSMKDEDNLNYYLKEQIDHIGRNALEIYAENNFSILLNDISVGDIVGKMWYGTGYELSMFRFFRLTRILTCNIVYEKYETIVSKDYLPKDSVYSFQFNHYIKNCSMRFSVSGVMIIFSTLLYQVVIFLYVEETRTEGDPFINRSFYLFALLVNMKAILNLLNSLLFFIYYYKTGRRPRISIFDLTIDIILFIAILINFFNLPNVICNYDDQQECNLLLNGILYSVIITTSWMRVIGILLKTLAYGSFFRIMFQIVWHVFVFLIITFCLDFCFAQVFTIFFKKSNESFQEIFYGFITLFNTAFGQVQFENFTQLTIYGYVCLISYTTVSNIMLFNLIVGIIDNLFDSLGERAEAENRSLLILAHERIKWDDRFGLLILLPSPFNAFSLIFIIILLIASQIDEEIVPQLNMIFSKICYFFIALSYFFILIIIGLISLPFAFIKSIAHSCYDTIANLDSVAHNSIINLLQILIFRVFDFNNYFFNDLFLFWKLVYKDAENRQNFYNKNVITKDYILAIQKKLVESKFKEKKKILTMDEMFYKLGIKMKRRKPQYCSDNNYSAKSPSNINSAKISDGSFVSSNSRKDTYQIDMMKSLIEKITDTDGIIDIERTLCILPQRVRYDEVFLNSVNHINVRVLLKGLRKYFFGNDVTNSIYSYKKMQNLVYKLLIKFNLIYNYIQNEKGFDNLKMNFNTVNQDQKYQKTSRAFGEYEAKEDISEYDDAGDVCFNHSEIGQGNTTE